MNLSLTHVIDLKERIALSPEFTREERDFILGCIVEAIKGERVRAALVEAMACYIHARRLALLDPDTEAIARWREALDDQ